MQLIPPPHPHPRTFPPLHTHTHNKKVEITLVKANSSIHWHTLEKGKGPAAAGVGVAAAPAAPAAPAAAGAAPNQQQQQAGSTTAANVRQYPSSKGPKDWSKVEGGFVVVAFLVVLCAGDGVWVCVGVVLWEVLISRCVSEQHIVGWKVFCGCPRLLTAFKHPTPSVEPTSNTTSRPIFSQPPTLANQQQPS